MDDIRGLVARAEQDIKTFYCNPSAMDEDVRSVLEALFNGAYDLGYGKGYDRGVMDTGVNR
jgi:hypothetical protein